MKLKKYVTDRYSHELIEAEWRTVSTGSLARKGYRIEVDKIVNRLIGGKVIYYYYIEESDNEMSKL